MLIWVKENAGYVVRKLKYTILKMNTNKSIKYKSYEGIKDGRI